MKSLFVNQWRPAGSHPDDAAGCCAQPEIKGVGTKTAAPVLILGADEEIIMEAGAELPTP
jgi:hypothetical protein